MNSKEKFMALVSGEDTTTLSEIKERVKNREMLRASQKIAAKVLLKLRGLKWTQRDLAEKLGVSPQQVSKIVSGKENMTLETLLKLQNLLDIPLLAGYPEKKTTEAVVILVSKKKPIVDAELIISVQYALSSPTEVVCRAYEYEEEYTYPEAV